MLAQTMTAGVTLNADGLPVDGSWFLSGPEFVVNSTFSFNETSNDLGLTERLGGVVFLFLPSRWLGLRSRHQLRRRQKHGLRSAAFRDNEAFELGTCDRFRYRLDHDHDPAGTGPIGSPGASLVSSESEERGNLV